jgi:hypothetical protein
MGMVVLQDHSGNNDVNDPFPESYVTLYNTLAAFIFSTCAGICSLVTDSVGTWSKFVTSSSVICFVARARVWASLVKTAFSFVFLHAFPEGR